MKMGAVATGQAYHPKGSKAEATSGDPGTVALARYGRFPERVQAHHGEFPVQAVDALLLCGGGAADHRGIVRGVECRHTQVESAGLQDQAEGGQKL